MYLIVWNLVRMTMAKFAQRIGVSVWRVSFIDTVRALQTLLKGPQPTELKLLNRKNPDRPSHDGAPASSSDGSKNTTSSPNRGRA